MEIQAGLFEHMVLQRNARGVSQARIIGSSHDSGTLQMRVTRGGRPAPKFNWHDAATVTGGWFTAGLNGLPAGGPYDIQLRIVVQGKKTPLDTLVVRDVLVGDVWVLAGQSNMEGCGHMKHAVSPDPLVRAFYMHEAWNVAKDPLHDLHRAVDPVHAAIGVGAAPAKRIYGVGPGLAFGKEMRRVTGVPQGLISCAHGGTSMEQWNPEKKEFGASLYGAALRRVVKNGGRVAGVAWYQGESDASAEAAALYTQRMQQLVATMRNDFGNATAPFVMVQIARVVGSGDPVSWNSIQDQQRRLPESISRLAVVPAIDLALDDGIHVGGPDTGRLGARLAQAAAALTLGRKAGPLPLALKKVTIETAANGERADVIVEFNHVQGILQAGARPVGFTVLDANNLNCVYGVELQGKRAIVHLNLNNKEVHGRSIWYGHGCDPVCNICDSADRAVPAFGPVPLK